MDFMSYAEKHKEEIIRSTQELLQIPSIEGDPSAGDALRRGCQQGTLSMCWSSARAGVQDRRTWMGMLVTPSTDPVMR